METRKKQNNLPLTHLYLDSGALSALLTPVRLKNLKYLKLSFIKSNLIIIFFNEVE